MKRHKLLIGIDSGKATGFAVWNTQTRKLQEVTSYAIHKALEIVRQWHSSGYDIKLYIEDARQVRFGTNPLRQQGAGSIKRDAVIWEDFCKYHKIPYEMVRPLKATTKWTAIRFKQATGWTGITNEHARDAAMIVYNR